MSIAEQKFLVVGAGFSGAVLARELVERTGCRVDIIDERAHIGGNCYSEKDASTGIQIHTYGPHIFNTDLEHVWSYVNRFGEFRSFSNRVKASTPRGVFTLPINLHTINQFFGTRLAPIEAQAFLAAKADSTIKVAANFEERALQLVGPDLYENFFKGYTTKQWGCDPRELPASILSRLPIRFSYNDNYYSTKYQGIPVEGYTTVIERILDHDRVSVALRRSFDDRMMADYDHVFYSGPIDAFFHFSEGRLGYRTVTFERVDAIGDFQGNAVINYPDISVPFTRIHEHKHFTPWESFEKTVAFREYSKKTEAQDTPYYPTNLAPDRTILQRYQAMAGERKDITFIGRLGSYRYLDMDDVIDEALISARDFIAGGAGRKP